MERMTELERFRAFLERGPMDRPLRYAKFTEDLRTRLEARLGGQKAGDYFNTDSGAGVSLRKPEGYQPPDFTRYFEDIQLDDRTTINERGVAHQRGSMYHFTHYVSPLRNAATFQEIEAFPIDTRETWTGDHLTAEVEKAHANGRRVIGSVGHMYEDSWQIRGLEQFLTDLVERPEWCESILDRVTERNLRTARAVAAAGADMLSTGDDIASQKAMMFSPATWRKIFKTRWARVYSAAAEIKPDIAIWYHSDGNIQAVIDDLIEIGVTVLNPLQPECMDVEQIYHQYNDRLLFDGAIGTQSVMPWGSADDVRAMVRSRRELFGGSLILSPTHVLEPEVPIENVFAFFEAADEPWG